MEKLTIEHIAPYLPHELMVTFENDPYHHLVLGFEFDELIIQSPFNDVGTTLIKDSIPLLLPLSYLTKEILHNGERFVPIVRLLEMAYPEWLEKHPEGKYREVEYSQEGYYANACFKYMATKDISIHTGFMWNVPHWIIKQLYAWHFDIDGLIDKGMAMDLNTIEI